MNWNDILKLIVTLLTFALAAIEFDFLIKFKNKNKKKRWIGVLFIALIISTIWDTTKESIDNRDSEIARDKSIKVDSLRSIKIINNLNRTLQNFNHLDESLKIMKDSIDKQVFVVNNILKNAEKVSQQQEIDFNLARPKILFYSMMYNTTFNKDSTLKELRIDFVNKGKRVANNFISKFEVIKYDNASEKFTKINIDKEKEIPNIESTRIEPQQLTGGNYHITLKIKPNTIKFSKKDKLIISVKLTYDDLYLKNIKQHEYLISELKKPKEFKDSYKEIKFIERIEDYLKKKK